MSQQFSAEQLKVLHDSFEIFDKDQDGEISCDELQQVLLAAGKGQTKEQVQEMIKSVDTNANGTVSFPELVKMMEG